MGLFPEKEPVKNVIERLDEANPLSIERKEVVTPVPTQFKAQISDDKGTPLVTTPQTQKVSVKIPALNEEELKEKSRQNVDRTIAWNASFLLRLIKKAIHLGRSILFSPVKGGQ